MLVLGEKEKNENTVSVERHIEGLSVKDYNLFADEIEKEN